MALIFLPQPSPSPHYSFLLQILSFLSRIGLFSSFQKISLAAPAY